MLAPGRGAVNYSASTLKWKRVKNKDVIDIRGASGSSRSGGGRGSSSASGGPLGDLISGSLGKLGGGGAIAAVVVIIAIQVLGGGGGFDLSQGLGSGAAAPGADNPAPIPASEDPDRDLKDFSTYVFTDAQDTWEAVFEADNRRYDNAQLVLYSGAVKTEGCGNATSAVGPFYCPADERVYLDLGFYGEMERQLNAPGDFAWAYVIAHEMGHHVQQLTGVSASVRRLEQENPGDTNELSVRQELQADCYAGVWASTVFAEGDLEDGDIEEAFTATEAVGDDRLQQQSGVAVDPDSFTHGTSEQRREWFDKGYDTGSADACDTFSVDSL